MSDESQFFVLTQDVTVPDPEGDLAFSAMTFGQPRTLKAGSRFHEFDGIL